MYLRTVERYENLYAQTAASLPTASETIFSRFNNGIRIFRRNKSNAHVCIGAYCFINTFNFYLFTQVRCIFFSRPTQGWEIIRRTCVRNSRGILQEKGKKNCVDCATPRVYDNNAVIKLCVQTTRYRNWGKRSSVETMGRSIWFVTAISSSYFEDWRCVWPRKDRGKAAL